MKKSYTRDVVAPLSHEEIKVKEMGAILELVHCKHNNHRCPIARLNGEQYIDLKTGEVKEFAHMESRADDLNGVRISLTKLRDLINTNVLNVLCCKWVTLTYAQPDRKPMRDTVRLYKDFKCYIKRLHRRYGAFEYIVAMEPQASGSWHAHVILIFPGKALFIPNDEMAKIWGQGFTVTRNLDDVDNVGAYLTAYLGDMEFDEFFNAGGSFSDSFSIKELEVVDDSGRKQTKRFIKGGRLPFYPPKFNLFRCSRGCKRPKISYMTEESAQKKVGAATPTFAFTVSISDEETGFENEISHRFYNKNRNLSSKKEQDCNDNSSGPR